MVNRDDRSGAPSQRLRWPARRRLGRVEIIEDHLSKHEFLVGDYSIADIALFAYTHVSHEGGFPLDDFPTIRAWIGRVKAQPEFVPMM
jgi:glutathione S-transferase